MKSVLPTTTSSPSSSTAISSKAAKLVPFLKKLQNLSEQCPNDIGHWSCDGKQFDIVDPVRFSNIVLKEHFPNSNTKTFFRQLFYYGFTQLNIMNGGGDERTKGTFSIRHPSFLRDSPSRIFEIKRSAKTGGANHKEEMDDFMSEDNRVDQLEQKLSALQSVVDDLSRKLAVLQLQTSQQQQQQQVATPAQAVALPPPPPPVVTPRSTVNRRKRVHTQEEEEEVVEDVILPETRNSFMADEEELFVRLDSNEIFNLFGDAGDDLIRKDSLITSEVAKTETPSIELDVDKIHRQTATPPPPPPPAPAPAPVSLPQTTTRTDSNALCTQKLLAALSSVSNACSQQARAAEQAERNKLKPEARLMSV